MNTVNKISFTILLLTFCSILHAQTKCLTITQLIDEYYKSKSPVASLAAKNLRIKHLNYQNRMAVYNLSAKLDLSLPYSNSIESVVQPDGNSIYIPRSYLSPVYTLTTAKKIPATGGTIGLSTSLSYFKNFLNTNQQFNANWYNLFITQPFFAYNEYKYDKKLQRLTLQADSIQYYKDRETQLQQVITRVIDYTIAKIGIKNSEMTIANYTTALAKSRLLCEAGRVLPVDTLLLYNNLQQSHLQHEQLIQTLNNQRAAVNFYLPNAKDLNICDFEAPRYNILDSAILNKQYLEYNNAKELIVDAFVNAENITRAKKAHGISTSIVAGNGINQSATSFEPLFSNPLQKQSVTLAVSLPLTGWNTYKRGKEIAELQNQTFEISKKEMIFLANAWTVEQINSNLYLHKSYQLIKGKLQALEDLQKIQLEKILLGRLNATEYNTTQTSISETRLEMLNTIKQIILLRLELRSKTLYDMELMENVF